MYVCTSLLLTCVFNIHVFHPVILISFTEYFIPFLYQPTDIIVIFMSTF